MFVTRHMGYFWFHYKSLGRAERTAGMFGSTAEKTKVEENRI